MAEFRLNDREINCIEDVQAILKGTSRFHFVVALFTRDTELDTEDWIKDENMQATENCIGYDRMPTGEEWIDNERMWAARSQADINTSVEEVFIAATGITPDHVAFIRVPLTPKNRHYVEECLGSPTNNQSI